MLGLIPQLPTNINVIFIIMVLIQGQFRGQLFSVIVFSPSGCCMVYHLIHINHLQKNVMFVLKIYMLL